LLRFAVHDTGIGIQLQDHEKLFTAFTQLTRGDTIPPDGTGLGLAISRELVNLMGGDIGVESEPDEGSCFWFEIPLVPGSSSAADLTVTTGPATDSVAPVAWQLHDQPVASPPAAPAVRILLAEDSPANQVVARALLKETGYHIDTVNNGKQAVESLRNQTYDLVLMDISMPEMNGMQATAVIRELAGDKGRIPIIAMTAHAIKGDREKFLAAGMNDYISKPIDKQLLFKVLEKWLPESPAAAQAVTAEEAESQAQQVLDISTLEQLARDTSPELLPSMLAAFRTEAASRVQAISEHLTPPAVEQLQREAHSLKSSAGTFGAFDLQQLTLEMELACRSGQLDHIEETARSITEAWDRVSIALDHYLSNTKTARTAAS